jgi:tRNA A37 methylthiotransferase MiaB
LSDGVRVGLVQINMGLTWSNPRRRPGEPVMSFGLLPYSAGLLQVYAERHAPGRHEFLLPLYKRIDVDAAVEHLAPAEVAGFSAYVWNERLSLEIARRLKERHPETLIVFGGPQVPDRSEAWLRAHPWVDVAVHGEGEAVFTTLLDRAAGRDWDDVPGISFLRDGAYELHARAARIGDMVEIPSPYLEETFRPLMEANPTEGWVMIWETNRGCPFSCTFCDWGSATNSKVFRFDIERVEREVEWMGVNRIGFVFCSDANFGMLKRDVEIAEAVVETKRRHGFPFSFSVQNTKNATERAYRIQHLLNTSLNALGVTLSLQSTNAQTLANIKRANISSDSYRELQRRFAADGVYTYTDIILGLPGESYDAFADGVAQAIDDGQHNHVQFHNCSLLPNAEMAHPDYVARFGIRTVPQLIRNAHDAVDLAHELEEYLDTVVATDAMPPVDWARAKVYAWASDLFYFDRTLQLPIALLQARHGVSPRASVERLLASEAPTLRGAAAAMRAHATGIQAGGPEYLAAPEWGNMLWPADQHALITLVLGGDLERFYVEAADELAALLPDPSDDLALREAVELNQALLRVPFVSADLPLVLSHALLEHHRGLLAGEPVSLEERLVTYVVDRSSQSFATAEAWFQHLTWCHGKDKRGYLYTARTIGAPVPVAA